jgi:hypothetical protein
VISHPDARDGFFNLLDAKTSLVNVREVRVEKLLEFFG